MYKIKGKVKIDMKKYKVETKLFRRDKHGFNDMEIEQEEYLNYMAKEGYKLVSAQLLQIDNVFINFNFIWEKKEE